MEDAQGLYGEGEQAFNAGDYERALSLFTELAMHPGQPADGLPEISWNMALCKAHLGDWEDAWGHIANSGFGRAEFEERLKAGDVTPPPGPGPGG